LKYPVPLMIQNKTKQKQGPAMMNFS